MGCFVYVLFGTSKDITLGPTAILSLLTASLTGTCGDVEDRINCALSLTFLSGAIQLALGLLNLGKSGVRLEICTRGGLWVLVMKVDTKPNYCNLIHVG